MQREIQTEKIQRYSTTTVFERGWEFVGATRVPKGRGKRKISPILMQSLTLNYGWNKSDLNSNTPPQKQITGKRVL